MRGFGKCLMMFCFVLVAGSLALSQQPFGGFGKGKGGQALDTMSLFQNPQVRAALKVSEEQLANLPAASLKALAEVLNGGQLQRLRGIYLQQKGNAAFLEAAVKKELKLSTDQVNTIKAALDEQQKGQAAAGGFAKMQELQKAATAKIQGALTPEQKTAWTNLLGQPFQLAAGKGGAIQGDFSAKPPVEPASPQEQLKRFLLPEGYKMTPVLTEPHILEPVCIAFDGNGRMFVAEMRTYMQDADATDEHTQRSRISMHESTKGDGVYDRHTVFVDNLLAPRAILPLDKGRIVTIETDAKDAYVYTDTDGDGVADKKELFCTGIGRQGNLEHQESGMVWALDNWIYTTYNAFRVRWTPQGMLRESTGFNGGQWGLSQDNYGKLYFVDGGGERGPVNFQVPIVYGAFAVSDEIEKDFRVPWPAVGLADFQGGMIRVKTPEMTLNHFTAAAGSDVFRGHRLPQDLVGDLTFGEPVGRLVRRAKVVVTDGLTQLRNAYPKSEFIRSTDPLFRPVNMATAPDGTLYIVDMYRGIIQEGNWTRPGSYLRMKIEQYAMDKVIGHGRIWQVTYQGMEPDRRQPRMLDETPAQLVAHLEHPNGWWRDMAQRLLVLRQDKSVAPALENLVRQSASPLARIHALWTLEGLGAADAALVRAQLKTPDAQMRVQALRVSESLYKAGDKSLEQDIRALARDADPNVAIQSLLTLNLLKIPDAAALVKTAVAASPSRGVREIGQQLLTPKGFGKGGKGSFGQLTAEQQKVMNRGLTIYQELCFSCHGMDGKGAPLAGAPPGTTMAPSLAGSPRAQGHADGLINVLLHGLIGPVDGKSYSSLMIPMDKNDDDWIVAIGSFVRNSFGNSAPFLTAAQVAKVRAASNRKVPWTLEELDASVPRLLTYAPDWKLTASHNGQLASNAISGVGATRWDTGAAQQPGMWFQIELPRPALITELQLDSPPPPAKGMGFGGGKGAANSGYPRGYKVQTSLDGAAWSAPVAEGKGMGPTTIISFNPVKAKFVRVTQTESVAATVSWSIQRTRLFAAPTQLSTQTPRIAQMTVVQVLDAVQKAQGETQRGKQLFTELSCVACHTVKAEETPKGPFLGTIAKTYRRRELAEQVLLPSKIIAKGYNTIAFELKDGRVVQGFIVREAADAVTVRTGTAEELKIPIAQIEQRTPNEKSLMPENLVAHLTVNDFASLLAYLESLTPPGSP
jgi:putative heme-binding domain-containing protein